MTKIDGKEDSFKEYKIQVDIVKNGYSEIQKGVYLWESEFITAEQTSWLDGDESKGMDFSIYPYWITTDSGEEPEGFDSIASALESLV